jgi:hypothetical protein
MTYAAEERHFKEAFGGDCVQLKADDKSELDASVFKAMCLSKVVCVLLGRGYSSRRVFSDNRLSCTHTTYPLSRLVAGHCMLYWSVVERSVFLGFIELASSDPPARCPPWYSKTGQICQNTLRLQRATARESDFFRPELRPQHTRTDL